MASDAATYADTAIAALLTSLDGSRIGGCSDTAQSLEWAKRNFRRAAEAETTDFPAVLSFTEIADRIEGHEWSPCDETVWQWIEEAKAVVTRLRRAAPFTLMAPCRGSE